MWLEFVRKYKGVAFAKVVLLFRLLPQLGEGAVQLFGIPVDLDDLVNVFRGKAERCGRLSAIVADDSGFLGAQAGFLLADQGAQEKVGFGSHWFIPPSGVNFGKG